MKGKLTFIFPKSQSFLDDSPWFPLGIVYLGGIAQNAGYEITLIDQRREDITVESLAGSKAIMISVSTATVVSAWKIAEMAKVINIPVVVGGVHPSSVPPEETLSYADSVVIGHGVPIFSNLLLDLESGNLKKVYRRLELSPEDLNEIPILSRSLIPESDSYLPTLLSSVGCPYYCSFCAIPRALGYVRRSVEETIKELSIIEREKFTFVDDNLLGDSPQEAYNLFEAMQQLDTKLSFFGNFDISLIYHEQVIEEFIKAGGYSMFIGLESLDPDNLRFLNKLRHIPKPQNRKLVREDIEDFYREAIVKLQSYGITVFASFIFGLNNDTEKTMDHLIQFAIDVPDVSYLSILTPYPGTPLFRFFRKMGQIKESVDYRLFDFNHLTFEHPTLSAKEVYSAILCFYQTLANEKIAQEKSLKVKNRINLQIGKEVYKKLLHNSKRANLIYGSLIK